MSLQKRFSKKSNIELIQIIESADSYTSQAIDVAKDELRSRQLKPHVLQELAIQVHREKFRKMLDAFDPLNDQLQLPKSLLLGREELQELLKEEFEYFMDQREGFRFDVWQYAIGGIL